MSHSAVNTKVAGVLRRLERERRTGIFRTTAQEVSREVLFERGGIVGARSSSLDERLGEVMMRRGRITRQEFDNASVLVRSRGARLGDVLIEMRIVKREEVDNFVRAQLTEIASMLLREPPKRLEFEPDTSFGRVLDAPVRVADAILEASRRSNGHGHDHGHVHDLDMNLRPSLTPEANEILQTLHLESREAFVLSRCDGLTRVCDIFAQIPLAEEETARILTGLEMAAIITMEANRSSGH